MRSYQSIFLLQCLAFITLANGNLSPEPSTTPSSVPSIEPSAGPSKAPSDPKKKPNILVIFADDVGTGDVPGYWDTSIVPMPNLESLVAEGTRFIDVHSTPLCAPSRYVFLSGNYQHRGVAFPGLWNLNYKTNQFKPHQKSIAEILQDNGYHTGMFGKWHIGGKVPTIDSYKPKHLYAEKSTLLSFWKHDWNKTLQEGPGDVGFDTSFFTPSGELILSLSYVINVKFSTRSNLHSFILFSIFRTPKPSLCFLQR